MIDSRYSDSMKCDRGLIMALTDTLNVGMGLATSGDYA